MHKVTLRVYDLSKGLAKQASKEFIGIQMDGIWHTTVEIHGKEIFFSNSVTHTIPGQTHYGQPNFVHEFGETDKTEDDVEEMLAVLRVKFNHETYHILENNCNHFADDLVFFLVQKQLPQYIMDAHETVSKTPFGMMLMQSNMRFNPGEKKH